MDLMNAMRVFVSIAETGSFASAAGRLDLSSTAVSRQIAALEAHFNTRLLNRTTRRLSLTDTGEMLLEHAQNILGEFDAVEAILSQNTSTLTGTLRISTPVTLGRLAITPMLHEFRKRYPELQLDLIFSDATPDLIAERIDVALMIGEEIPDNLIARKLGSVRLVACATPSYLDTHGVPDKPDDLTSHAFLSQTQLHAKGAWTFHHKGGAIAEVNIQPLVSANNVEVIKEFVLQGQGIAVVPHVLIREDLANGKLVHILPEWEYGNHNLYATYLSRRYAPAKIRVFIDFLVTGFSAVTAAAAA